MRILECGASARQAEQQPVDAAVAVLPFENRSEAAHGIHR